MKRTLLFPILSICVFLFGCPGHKEDPKPQIDERESVKNVLIFIPTEFPLTINCNEPFEVKKVKVILRKPMTTEAPVINGTAYEGNCVNIERQKGSNLRMGPNNIGAVLEFDISKYKDIKNIGLGVTCASGNGDKKSEARLYGFDDKLIETKSIPGYNIDGATSVSFTGDFNNVKKVIIINIAEVTDVSQISLY